MAPEARAALNSAVISRSVLSRVPPASSVVPHTQKGRPSLAGSTAASRFSSRLRWDVVIRPRPPSPAAAIPNARTAGTSISAMFTSAQSHAALASRTIRIRGNGSAAFTLARTRASNVAALRQPLTRRARISRSSGGGFQPGAHRPTTKHGATSATGRPGNMPCGNVASGFHRSRPADEIRRR